MMSVSDYHCSSQFDASAKTEYRRSSTVDDDDVSVKSVKTFVAAFESQHCPSPNANALPSPGVRRSGVGRLRASHVRSSSEDFSARGACCIMKGPGCSSPLVTGESPRLDVVQEQSSSSSSRSVAELRAALQQSARQSFDGNSEQQTSRTRTLEGDDSFRPIGELKASLKQSSENLADCSDADGADPKRAERKPEQVVVNRKPTPKVLPKPIIKRLSNGEVTVVRPSRCRSVGSEISYDSQSSEVNPENSASGIPSKLSENIVQFKSADGEGVSEVSSRNVDHVIFPRPSVTNDVPQADERQAADVSVVITDELNSQSGDAPSRRRLSSRARGSGDSSRTSSNVSVFGSSINVDSVPDECDDEALRSDSFYSSQTDSGVVTHDSSYDSSINLLLSDTPPVVAREEASPRFDLQQKPSPDDVAGVLATMFGRSDAELCRVVCEWQSYRTGLDYVGDLFVETADVERYHVNLLPMYQHVADSDGVRYLSLEALTEAVRRKIQKTVAELQLAKASIESESSDIRQLQCRVTNAIKSKAADCRQFDKFGIYFDELDKMSVETRRRELVQKLDDARLLKTDIDRRSESLASSIVDSLDEGDCSAFSRLVTERCRLTLQRHEIGDWLRLAEEHLKLLRADSGSTLCDTRCSDVSVC